ncbi:MnhB domain-containing protein [Yoonia sp.]|uniref:MnhB domain-containing protein n=1 Tax=Yoonia sp. TaxID=2212373 RepID=UPI0035C82AE8
MAVLLLVFSVYMLLRGHNAQGGGFIGGLIAAMGFVVYAIACGTETARRALRFDPGSSLIPIGVAINKQDSEITVRVVAIILFLMLTSPIGAHMIGRASVRDLDSKKQTGENNS